MRCLSLIVAILLCMRNAQGQFGPCTNTHSLYSPLKPTVIPNPKGEFLTPMATGTNIFTEGSTMNVSWTSTFERVNLWLIVNGQYDFGGKYGGPVALAQDHANTSYLWTVDCHGRCHYLFVLHILNATAQGVEGGVWSRRFWIRPSDPSAVSTVTKTTISTTTDKPTVLSSTAKSTPSPSGTATKTSNKHHAKSPASSTTQQPSNDSQSTTIGVGVGVGVGVAVLAIGAFFLWRRYRAKREARYARPPSSFGHNSDGWRQSGPPDYYQPNPLREVGTPDPAEVEAKEARALLGIYNAQYSPYTQELPADRM